MSAPIRVLDVRRPRQRFARAMNIERDAGTVQALATFLPVGRALDVVDRVMTSLSSSHSESAFAVTGPYGSGKSSLALLLDALLAPKASPEFELARDLLQAASEATMERVTRARGDNGNHGLLRCFVTAQREPVGRTILRALLVGVDKTNLNAELTTSRGRVLRLLQADSLETRDVVRAVTELAAVRPLVLLIDEFGKSLEAVAGNGAAAADLFLLQELAERSIAAPYVLVTLQHLAIGDYATELGSRERREWAKVQGRFEELSYVEGQAQTLHLIAAAFEPLHDEAALAAVSAWSEREAATSSELGLSQLDAGLLAGAWPLHPTALVVLPDLVQRYGQNERTLFSFLAAPGTASVPEWLHETIWNSDELPLVRLHQVYDYFVAPATAMSSYSAAATRWVEIDTRIRDARGLSEGQLRVLKGVGLLNLVAGGGELRASRTLVAWAMSDGLSGTETTEAVQLRLRELEAQGLLSWRAFSDEYRVWHGSDFDLRSAVERVREQLKQVPLPELLERNAPLVPVVAARHSHATATLRAFDCRWTNNRIGPEAARVNTAADGLVLFSVGGPSSLLGDVEETRPVVVLELGDAPGLVSAAREAEALRVLHDEAPKDDWVIRRELAERHAEARSALDVEIDEQLQRLGARQGFYSVKDGHLLREPGDQSLSSLLSQVCDRAYAKAPIVRNELLNRHQLSSQAAKARRELLEALLQSPTVDGLDLHGFGPEVAMYRAVLKSTGIHRRGTDGAWQVGRPDSAAGSSLLHVWNHLVDMLCEEDHRLPVAEIFKRLAEPPYGLREGVAPVLLTCVLIAAVGELALYEHGTFKAGLTPDLLERLVRNPQYFELRHFRADAGFRRNLIDEYAVALAHLPGGRAPVAPSVVGVVSALVRFVNALPEFSRRTTTLDPEVIALRQAVMRATEPDVLLFDDIPRILGVQPVQSGRSASAVARGLARTLQSLRGAYPGLLRTVQEELISATRAFTSDPRVELAQRADPLDGKVLDSRLATLVKALRAAELEDDAWLEYVAMMVVNTAPSSWRDDDVVRYRMNVAQLGGAFRRLEALTLEARAAAHGNGFSAVLITITQPDGKDTSTLARVQDAHRPVLDQLVAAALQQAQVLFGDPQEARDALLAVLAAPVSSASDDIHDVVRATSPYKKAEA